MCRLVLSAVARQQVNAPQQQPVQTATSPDVVAPAGAAAPGVDPGGLGRTMVSANSIKRCQIPLTGAPTTVTLTTVTVDGHVCSHTVTKLMYSINYNINSYAVRGSWCYWWLSW
jgi:hypothetical protein